jgi:diaminopimelate epimerase
MQIPYRKMHGTGNRILVVDQRDRNLPPPSVEKLRELGDERTGPGFDQLMWVVPSTDESCLAGYRVFNADGSEVEQCGNGVRCVAKYLSDTSDAGSEFALESPAGLVSVQMGQNGSVAVSMGTPVFVPDEIPFLADAMAETYALQVGTRTLPVSVVSMGNPHCVVPVDDVAEAAVGELGPAIENHERFPERVNVGFMRIQDRSSIDLRVHERGVGETAACGTGACAAVASGQRLGLLDDEVTVELPGGQVVVSWRGRETPVWLTGDAELINEGMVDLQE